MSTVLRLGFRGGVDAAGPHEVERSVDLRSEALVALARRAGGHELLVPRVDPGEVGEASLGEGPDEVQRRGGLVVGLDEAVRIGHAGGHIETRTVDVVTAERRQVDVADAFRRAGPRLGELPGDAADLDDRRAERVREHDGHLEDDAQLLPDVVGGELLERFGAVAGLEEERPPRGDLGQ